MTLRLTFHHHLTHCAHTRNGANGGALELGDLEFRVEHVLDEGRVLVDFVRCAGQLELLDDLERVVDLEDHASGADAEGAGLGAADAARRLLCDGCGCGCGCGCGGQINNEAVRIQLGEKQICNNCFL